MHGDGFPDDQTILGELADVLARVGVGDFINLVRVEPNLTLAALEDGSGQALLGTKICPGKKGKRRLVHYSRKFRKNHSILRLPEIRNPARNFYTRTGQKSK